MAQSLGPRWPYELFGIECGQGWRTLYAPLMKRCEEEGVAIHQIKEKFGGLRFYVDHTLASEDLLRDIDEAEHRSLTMCEKCGEPGRRHVGAFRWIRTLCDACEKARQRDPRWSRFPDPDPTNKGDDAA